MDRLQAEEKLSDAIEVNVNNIKDLVFRATGDFELANTIENNYLMQTIKDRTPPRK